MNGVNYDVFVKQREPWPGINRQTNRANPGLLELSDITSPLRSELFPRDQVSSCPNPEKTQHTISEESRRKTVSHEASIQDQPATTMFRR